jgi:hypothetical protein
MDRIIRAVIEIKLYPNNINRADMFSLRKSRKSLNHTLKEQKKNHSKNKASF